MTIVKVCVPLAWTGGAAPGCLVYDQERQHIVEQSVPARIVAVLDGAPKGYFEATWDGRKWTMWTKVEDQPW